MNNEAYLVPNPATPCQAIRIDPELCISCYRCADQCRTDIMVRNLPKENGFARFVTKRHIQAGPLSPGRYVVALRRVLHPLQPHPCRPGFHCLPGAYEGSIEWPAR